VLLKISSLILAVDLLTAGYQKNEVARHLNVTPSRRHPANNHFQNRGQAFRG
jgi:hypothetical protein